MDRKKELQMLNDQATKPYHELIEEQEAAELAEEEAIIKAEMLMDLERSDDDPEDVYNGSL